MPTVQILGREETAPAAARHVVQRIVRDKPAAE
jgi:hypothetical protein